MTRSRTLLAVLALALPLPAAIAGCGGGDSSSGESPQTVLDKTFNNDTSVSSGNLDVTVEASADGSQGGSVTASLSGPFQGDASQPNTLPQLDWTGSIKADGAGQSVDGSAEITVTSDNAYVTYNGQAYEVGKDTFTQLKDQLQSQASSTGSPSGGFTEQFKKGCEDAISKQGGDPSTCNFDLSSWFTNLSNGGSEDIAGTGTTKITGSVDVTKMLGDLFKLGSSVPGANTSGLSPDLIQSQLGTISAAVTDASFTINSGTDDNILRKLEFNIAVDPSKIPGGSGAGVSNVNLKFDVTLSDVNSAQTITAPANPKPITDLQGQLGTSIPGLGGSIPGLGTGATGTTGASGSSSGGSSALGTDPKAAQAYLDCLSKAGSNIDKINACPIPK